MEKLILFNSYFVEIAASLKNGKAVMISVLGDSMLPFLKSGDVIELTPYIGDKLPRWSVIFYCYNGHYIIHRIIGRKMASYTAMGDGNLWMREKIGEHDVFGVLTKVYHSNGKCSDCLSVMWRGKGALWHLIRLLHQLICVVKSILS